MPITYFDRKTSVQLGDRVETRVWFRKRFGRVAYLPGSSSHNADFEHHGLQWVGIRLDGGTIVASLVDPIGNYLVKKYVKLLERDSSSQEDINLGDEGFDGFTP